VSIGVSAVVTVGLRIMLATGSWDALPREVVTASVRVRTPVTSPPSLPYGLRRLGVLGGERCGSAALGGDCAPPAVGDLGTLGGGTDVEVEDRRG
jgi:hypothetical protein